MHTSQFFLLSLALLSACSSLPRQHVLDGATFYPESVHASRGGTLYVGSLGTGAIVSVEASTDGAVQTFVPAGSAKGFTGVHVDDDAGALWACAVDVSQNPPHTEVRRYALDSHALVATYPFATAAFCNDFARDAQGNLFVSDSFGKIWRLAHGDAALAVWSADARLAATQPGGFGADGIALDGQGHLFVNTYSDGRLLRIDIAADGSPGSVTEITVTPALSNPDGMRMLDANTLISVESGGRVAKIALAGNAGTLTPVANVDAPTAVVVVDGHAWVAEGQVGHFLGVVAGPPNLPFAVRRVDL